MLTICGVHLHVSASLLLLFVDLFWRCYCQALFLMHHGGGLFCIHLLYSWCRAECVSWMADMRISLNIMLVIAIFWSGVIKVSGFIDSARIVLFPDSVLIAAFRFSCPAEFILLVRCSIFGVCFPCFLFRPIFIDESGIISFWAGGRFRCFRGIPWYVSNRICVVCGYLLKGLALYII